MFNSSFNIQIGTIINPAPVPAIPENENGINTNNAKIIFHFLDLCFVTVGSAYRINI